MLTTLYWATWALAVSPSMAEATVKPVKWVDLMIATSKFPRFFGSSPHVSRTGPPKITGLSIDVKLAEKQNKPPYGDIIPLSCSSDSETFSCRGAKVYDGPGSLVIYSALQESRTSLGHDLDGLSFNVDYYHLRTYNYDKHTRYSHYFSQNMGGLLPIDNSLVVLGLNKWDTNGSTWFAPEQDRQIVYRGEFDHEPTHSACDKHLARDTAALSAFNQPFWSALFVPQYALVYTVQDGRLHLTWRLKFDLTKQVGDNFYVWVNARNCSQVVAAAPEKMDSYTRSLGDFQKEQRRLFEEQGIPFGNPPSA